MNVDMRLIFSYVHKNGQKNVVKQVIKEYVR